MNQDTGYRSLINVYNCDRQKLAKVGAVQEGLEYALHELRPVAKDFFYQFSPQGVTGLSLWREGHFSIHTWPERGMAAIDVVGYPYCAKNLLRRLQDVFPAYYAPVQSTRAVKKGTPRVGQEVYGSLGAIKQNRQLEDERALLDLLKTISHSAHFKVIGEVARSDEEIIDAAVILSESHFSVHYTRKRREMMVDIFTCGKEGDPQRGYDLLQSEIKAEKSQRVYVRR